MSLLEEVQGGLRIQYAPVSGACVLTRPVGTGGLSAVAAGMVKTTGGFMDELVRPIHAWEMIELRDASSPQSPAPEPETLENAMSSIKATLTVTVVHVAGRKANAKGRKAPATIGLVSFGGVLIASTKAPIAGRYDQDQLLARLRSHPAEFRVTEPGADVVPHVHQLPRG